MMQSPSALYDANVGWKYSARAHASEPKSALNFDRAAEVNVEYRPL